MTTRSPPVGWGTQNAAPRKFDPKPLHEVFSTALSNFDKYIPQVAGGVISGVVVEYADMGVYVMYGNSRSQSFREICVERQTTTTNDGGRRSRHGATRGPPIG